MKIYAFSGLGADERVFQFLELDYEIIPISWIDPQENESIESYSKRISETIDTSESYLLLGVSFGGLIATEIAKQLHPSALILISSICTKSEIPIGYRLMGKFNLIKLLPKQFIVPSPRVAQVFFQAKNKTLLRRIIESTHPTFAKWALGCLIRWENSDIFSPMIRIHGEKDRILKPQSWENIHKIEAGSHFMIVDHAKEISSIINREINKIFER